MEEKQKSDLMVESETKMEERWTPDKELMVAQLIEHAGYNENFVAEADENQIKEWYLKEFTDEQIKELMEEAESDAPEEPAEVNISVPNCEVVVRADMFRNLIASANAIVDGGIIKVSKDNMSISAMSNSSISMVISVLDRMECSKYEIESEANLPLNFKEILDILPKGKEAENSSLSLKTNNDEVIININNNGISRSAVFPLSINNKRVVGKEPNVAFKANIGISASLLKEIIKRAEQIHSQQLKIIAEQDKVVFEARGANSRFSESYPRLNLKKLFLEGKDIQELMFSLEEFKKLVRCANKDSVIELNILNGEPLKVAYLINSQDKVIYWLAPYMDND
ncbi:MAG: hypothetical protein ACYCS1_05335 [Gammaproteobacteria bacterium]